MIATLILSLLVSLVSLAFVLFLRDSLLSARKLAREREEALSLAQENRRQVEHILDHAPIALWTTDRDLTITRVQGRIADRAEDLLGLSVAEVLADSTSGLLAVDGHRRALEGEAVSFPIRWRGRDFDVRVEPIRESDGEISGVAGVGVDVTGESRAEEALRLSDERYRSLFDESQDVIFITTPDGKLVDINQAGVEMFGYDSREQLLQLNVARDLYWEPADRERHLRPLAERGAVRDQELHLKHRDGSRLIVLETTNSVVDARGEVVALRGIMRDVTERRALEQQLRRAQRMEAVARLAGGVAHDFNNLLTVINGRAELALLLAEDHPALAEEVTAIKEAGASAVELTSRLLQLSRHRLLPPIELDLAQTVRDLSGELARLAGSEVEIDLRLPAGPLRVRADPRQIERLILDLVINAVEAMPDGGRLVVRGGVEVVGEEDARLVQFRSPGRYARLDFEDEGRGVAPEVREHLFEPFVTSKSEKPGAGLGLATVYSVVSQAGGYVDVTSSSEGTCVSILVPLDESEESAAALEARSRPVVLLVEDQTALRQLLGGVLESHGYRVLQAVDAEDALRLVEDVGDEPLDLLVTDIVLPLMSGVHLAREMTRRRPQLPVLLITGYSEAVSEELEPEERDACLRKPFSASVFLGRVAQVMERSRAQP